MTVIPDSRLTRWVRQNVELTTLALLVLLVAGLWAFAELADEVVEGSTRSLDADLLLLLRDPVSPDTPRGPWWLQEMGRDLTALGGVAALSLAILGTAGFFLLRHRIGSTVFLLAAAGGGMLLAAVSKDIFRRERPDLVAHGSLVETTSFPSGHSLMAAVVYLTLGVLIARSLPQRRLKAYVLCAAALLAILVGISRVYMGVHWPTDVLAGWIVGAAWAVLCLLVARLLARRGHVEEEQCDPPPVPARDHAPAARKS
jgi:undecaprenyl-diphosphatase